MLIVNSIDEMIKVAHTCRAGGRHCALVPTMGALHEGHLSLLSIAKERSDVTVMSIFVNPTQFGPTEDYSQYPRPFADDCARAEAAGCDIIFAPEPEKMYPKQFMTTVAVGDITNHLCGASRPDHFAGVTTVVLKLFNIVKPDVAVFGAKDAQQVIVIKRMVEDLHSPVEIVVGSIIREEDGLAKSSRNAYLSPAERKDASFIFKGISDAAARFKEGVTSSASLIKTVERRLSDSVFIKPEYISIVDPVTLLPVTTIGTSALLAVACRMADSGTRLIDNTFLGETLS